MIDSFKLLFETWNLITGNHILVIEEILHEVDVLYELLK